MTMMTYDMMMALLLELEDVEDVSTFTASDGITRVTIEDFEGFTYDGAEIYREYALPELVETLESFLAEHAEGDFYQRVELDGHVFQFDYGSFGI